jgi:hypothetical protein
MQRSLGRNENVVNVLPSITSGESNVDESNVRRQRRRRHLDVPAARKRVRNQVVKDMDDGEMAGPLPTITSGESNARRQR